jgi:hypothetical protein
MILFLWGVLSDERTGLSFVYAAGLCPRSLFWARVPWYLRPYFTGSDLRLFVTSYDSQGHGGGIRPRLYMEAELRTTELLNYSLYSLGTDYPQKTHQLLSNGYHVLLSGMSTHALPNNGCPVVAHTLLWYVFSGLLPSSALSKSIAIHFRPFPPSPCPFNFNWLN